MKVNDNWKKYNLTKKHYLEITFEFLPNFSGRNCFFRTEKTVEKTTVFSALEETGEPWFLYPLIVPRVFFFFFLTRRYSCLACWKCVDSVSTLSQSSCHWFSDNTFGVKLEAWSCLPLGRAEVAQWSSTTIGPQSPLHSAWAFMYLYSEGLHRILRRLAKFTFFVYLRATMITNHCICQYYGML